MSRYIIALALSLCLAGCGKEQSKPAQSSEKVLNVYIWAAYLPDSVVRDFTARTGIKVNVETYTNNEMLQDKLSSGMAAYDIVVPTDYKVKTLIRKKLIQEIDPARLKNLGNLDKRYLNQPFDPGNKYSLPYLWGTTGIGWNKKKIAAPIDSWKTLFDEKHKGQVLMLNDVRECFAVPLYILGKSVNSTEPADLAAAAEMLKAQKRNGIVRIYDSDDYDNILRRGDAHIAHGFNGQLAKLAAAEPETFAYAVPREGATRWMDNLCIPTSAPHLDNACLFIDFILEPKNSAAIVNGVSYAGANEKAREFIDPKIYNDPAIYVPDEILKRCSFMDEMPQIMPALQKFWTEIKAQ